MAYTPNPFNFTGTSPNEIQNDLDLANQNFTILGQAFIGNDPSSQPIKRAVYIGTTAPSDAVASTLWLDTSVSPPVLKIYNGTQWQVASSSSTDAKTVDGFPASLTPAPNTIVPLNANGILDLSATYVKSNVYTFRRVDLTNATSDYMLQVGEEAYISFSNATSVPLHIATQSGTYYVLHFICANTWGTSGASTNIIFLNPNNTTYSNAFGYAELYRNSGASSSTYTTYSAFRIGFAFGSLRVYITNLTQYKNVIGFCDIYGTSSDAPTISIFSNDWHDTTTAWTSLGTITFPQSTSGYILVRRLA